MGVQGAVHAGESQEGALALPRAVRRPIEQAIALSRKPGRAAFLARILGAANRLAERLDESSLAEVAGASSDLEALVVALSSPETVETLRALDPLLPARLRGVRDRERLLNAFGGPVGAGEAAAMLGISRQAVYHRRAKGMLLGVSTGRRGYLYPSWQFGPEGTLPGLGQVLQTIASQDPWSKLAFMVNPNDRLGEEAPVAVLRRGGAEALSEVVEAAQAYGEQGAA